MFNDVKVQQKIYFSNLFDVLFSGCYQLLEEYNFILDVKIFKKYNEPKNIRIKEEENFIKKIDKIVKK